MIVNGVKVVQTQENDKSYFIVNDDEKILINPDTISEAWILYSNSRYDLIKTNEGWKGNIYKYLLSNEEPNIQLIALLLSTKV